MKKVFALFIVLAIMCTFTATAFAEGTQSQEITLTIPNYFTLSKVAATVTLPTVGANPNSNVDIEDYNTYFTFKSASFYMDAGNYGISAVNENHQFIEGQTYRVEVRVDLKPEYRIDPNTTEFTINGIKATLSTTSDDTVYFYILYTPTAASPAWTLVIPSDVSITYPDDSIIIGDANIADATSIGDGKIKVNLKYDGLFKNTADQSKTISYRLSDRTGRTLDTEIDNLIGEYSAEVDSDSNPTAYSYKVLREGIKVSFSSDYHSAAPGTYKAQIIYSSEYSATDD